MAQCANKDCGAVNCECACVGCLAAREPKQAQAKVSYSDQAAIPPDPAFQVILSPAFPKKRLGNGAYGVAYGLTPDLVVKVTSSQDEYENACKLVGKKLQTCWDIVACGPLPAEVFPCYEGKHGRFRKGVPLFWILGERLVAVNPSRMKQVERSRASRLKIKLRAELGSYGVRHRDTHYGNLMQTKKGKLKFVDVM